MDLAGYESAALIGQGSPELVQETKNINEVLPSPSLSPPPIPWNGTLLLESLQWSGAVSGGWVPEHADFLIAFFA